MIHFKILSWIKWAWHTTCLDKGNSWLFKWRMVSFSKGNDRETVKLYVQFLKEIFACSRRSGISLTKRIYDKYLLNFYWLVLIFLKLKCRFNDRMLKLVYRQGLFLKWTIRPIGLLFHLLISFMHDGLIPSWNVYIWNKTLLIAEPQHGTSVYAVSFGFPHWR